MWAEKSKRENPKIRHDRQGGPLADIYAVIHYYLRHRQDVDGYLANRERQAKALRQQWEAVCPPDEIRRRLMARRATTPLE
jgi:hypothetical protein